MGWKSSELFQILGPMPHRVTLREVAEAAGVSLATASHAMRNERNAARATCLRVQETARRLGYRPDPLMAAISSRHGRRPAPHPDVPVLVLTNAPRPVGLRHRPALGRRLAELGYRLTVENVRTEAELERQARRAYATGTRAILFAAFENSGWIPGKPWEEFALVLLDRLCLQPFLHTVRMDVEAGFSGLLARAAETGWRVGYIHHGHADPGLLDDHVRLALFEAAQRARPDRFAPPLRRRFADGFADSVQAVRQWAEEQQPGLVIGYDLSRELLRAAALRPAPVFWGHSLGQAGEVPGCVEPIDEIATRAAEWVDNMIRHGEVGLPTHPAVLSIVPRWWPGTAPGAPGKT